MAELVAGVLALGAGVFAASAFGKLRSRAAYRDFSAGLRASGLLTGSLRNWVPMTLVVAEAVLACGLAGATVLLVARSPGGYPLAGAALVIAVVLAAVLTAGVTVTVRRGVRIACHCFGTGSSGPNARPLGLAHVIRNAFLFLVLAVGAVAEVLISGRYARPEPAASALAVLAGLLVAVLIARWDDLVSLLAAPPAPRGKTR